MRRAKRDDIDEAGDDDFEFSLGFTLQSDSETSTQTGTSFNKPSFECSTDNAQDQRKGFKSIPTTCFVSYSSYENLTERIPGSDIGARLTQHVGSATKQPPVFHWM